MNKLVFLLLVMVALTSCDQKQDNVSKYGAYAKQAFLEERSYMTEYDALSEEIAWYKAPQITDYSYYGELTGRNLITICNKIIAENERELEALVSGRSQSACTHNVFDIKDYAIKHPDENIASKYHLAATFSTFDQTDPYSNLSNDIIVVKEINRILILSDNQDFFVFGIEYFTPK